MGLDVRPSIPPEELQAIEEALERSGLDLDVAPDAYASAWRRAGLVEATGQEDDGDGYALSPRSTRGATRA